MGAQTPFVSANSQTEAFSRRARHTRILVDASRDLTANPRPAPHQIEAYKELFYQLAGQLLPADRRLISTLLAQSAYTPRSVAIYLAQDSLDVAIPCLLYSPVLGELDLKEIARKMGPAYRDVILKRAVPPLQESSLESLHDGEKAEEAVQDLVENSAAKPAEQSQPPVEEATLSQDASPFGRRPYATSLIEEIREDADQGTARTQWLDGEEIVALASAGGRLGRQKPGQQEASSPLQTHQEDAARERPALGAKRFERLAPRETRHLVALARSQNKKAMARQMANLSGMETKAISTLLRKRSGDELAYLLKALNPGSPHDLKLLLMLAPRYGRTPQAYAGAKALLGELDTGICRMIFNQVGAAFAMPSLEPAIERGVTGDTEFAAAARFRREEIGQSIDGRSIAPRPQASAEGQQEFQNRPQHAAGA